LNVVPVVRGDLDRSIPLQQRARNFWAGVCCARNIGSVDVVTETFVRLANETGLISDLATSGGSFSGRETVEHLIRWGLLERDPFGGRRS
jgi:hypothetical protein